MSARKKKGTCTRCDAPLLATSVTGLCRKHWAAHLAAEAKVAAAARTCRECGGPIGRRNASGLCQLHSRLAIAAVRTAAVPKRACTGCAGPVSRDSKSGLCRTCSCADPAVRARRGAGIRRAMEINPVIKEQRIARLTAINRQPHRRAKSGQIARQCRLWEHGLAKMTPEVRARAARTLSENRMAHVPRDYREMYRDLQARKDLSASEALAVVKDQESRDMKRFRARLAVQSGGASS